MAGVVSPSDNEHRVFDRMQMLKAFDETKAGVKGLTDSGLLQIPEIFVRPPDEVAEESTYIKTQIQVPVIDLSEIENSDMRKKIVEEARIASETWGFFQVVNHGIPQTVLDGMIEAVRGFNDQDVAEKKKYYSRDNTRRVRFNSSYDLFTSRTASWKDSLTLSFSGLDPIDEDELPPSCRVSLTLNMYFTSLKYTSPTLLACMVNTIAFLTFILAVILRMEIVNIRNPRGIAKILGTVVSLVGVMTMTLYKGPALKNIGHALIHIKGSTGVVEGNWLKGSLLTVASCITWSIRYIMQAYTLKRYPAQLSLTTWMNFVGAAQSAVFTVIVQHKRAAWTIGFDIDLWSTLYGGVVISGIVTFVQLWCTEAKGPVFVTMFNPLSTLLVAALAYFVLGEKLNVGRYMLVYIYTPLCECVMWTKTSA